MRISITGMTCQGCANKITEAIKKLPGAQNVNVNFALRTLDFEGLAQTTVIETLKKLGYDSPLSSQKNPFQIAEIQNIHAAEEKTAKYNLLIAAILGIPEFLIGMHFIPFLHTPLWLEAVLASIVVLYAGRDIHIKAFKQLRHGSLTMDTLVSLGSLAALLQRPSSFEAASTIVLFILIGKYLELRTRKLTFSSTSEIYKTLQKPVERKKGQETEFVSGLELKPEDIIIIKPGEMIPVDGVVVEGASLVNEASITGEAMPRKLMIGMKVISGGVIIDSPITIEVKQSGEECFLGRLLIELEKAQSKPANLQRLADRVTEVFIPIVLILATATALYHFNFNTFLSIILVACPCAMGLAIPTALVAGLGAASKKGILFRDAQTLEFTSQLKYLFFDKTGTLTIGAPQLTNIEILGSTDEKEILLLVASLEKSSLHPLAKAVVDYSFKKGVFKPAPVTKFKSIAGKGIEGVVNGKKVAVVRAEIEMSASQELVNSGTCSEVFIDDVKVARLFFIDAPRPEAQSILEELKSKGLSLHLLTGDNKSSVQALSSFLKSNLLETVHTELLPEDKKNILLNHKKTSQEAVGFVGDGLNDVLALSSADVGFALASGTPAALGAGHVTLTRGIKDLPLALNMAHSTHRQLYFNLFWAFAYNLVMIPWAMSGSLNPMWASLAMSASSVSVVLGSVYLGYKLKIK